MARSNGVAKLDKTEYPRTMRGDAGFWLTFRDGAPQHLQRIYTAAHERSVFGALCLKDKTLRTRVVSTSSRGADRWLTAYPAHPTHQLTDAYYGMAVRARLDLPPADDLPPSCKCGESPSSPAGHVHWCRKVRQRPTIMRHNVIISALNNVARAAGLTTHVEVTQPSDPGAREAERLRPDIRLDGALRSILTDVTISHPLAPSALQPNTEDDSIANIERSARNKSHKYAELADSFGIDLLPFATDVYGALGKQALELDLCGGDREWPRHHQRREG